MNREQVWRDQWCAPWRRWACRWVLVVSVAADLCAQEAASRPAVIPVERPRRTQPVDFQEDLLPFLQPNCLPCHNRTTPKADLLLETPADILRGGESGPAAIPGKASESLLLKLSTHEAKPRMPPKDNKANAASLTPAELGLLAAWIDEGCRESERRAVRIRWEPPAEVIQPVYAVAMAADGHVGLAGRGPRLALVRPLEGTQLGWLCETGLVKTAVPAHRDLVNSVAVSPDGEWLASGGYREVKLWRRSIHDPVPAPASVVLAPGFNGLLAVTNGQRVLAFTSNGIPELAAVGGGWAARLRPGPAVPDGDPERARRLAQASVEGAKGRVEAQEKELATQTERLKKALESEATARKALQEREAAERKARLALTIAEAVAERASRQGTATNLLKPMVEKVEAARKALDPVQAERSKAQTRLDTAGEELRLAELTRHRVSVALMVARQAWEDARRQTASVREPGSVPTGPGAWSPGGTRLALVIGKSISVWSTASGAWIASVPVGGMVGGLGFQDEERLGWTEDGNRRLWSFEPTYSFAGTLGTGGDDSPLADRVNALAFRSDGRRLATGSGEPTRGGEIRVWDPATGRLLYGFDSVHSDAVLALAWSPDGQRLASGGADRFARVTEVANGELAATLEGHSGHVLAVSWRADGRVLATGGADQTVKFWMLGTADKARTVSGFAKEVVGVCHLGTGGDALVVPGESDLVRVTEGGEKPATLGGARDFQHAAAVTMDGRWLMAGGHDGVVRVWDVEARKLWKELGR